MFGDTLRRLAAAAGEDFPGDPRDEHQRWQLYCRAMLIAACRAELLEAVSLDPDSEVALSVSLRMLEIEDASGRSAWIGVLRDERAREYASRRAREIEILEAFGRVPGLDAEAVDAWSDWLQLRLAEVSNVTEVLELLAARGRTRRIRRTAADRLTVSGRTAPGA